MHVGCNESAVGLREGGMIFPVFASFNQPSPFETANCRLLPQDDWT